MRSAGNFHPEWGYLAPAPSFMRTVRVVAVATAIGATAGAGVVVSLVARPAADDGNTSIAAHALITTVHAAAAQQPAPTLAAAPAVTPPAVQPQLSVQAPAQANPKPTTASVTAPPPDDPARHPVASETTATATLRPPASVAVLAEIPAATDALPTRPRDEAAPLPDEAAFQKKGAKKRVTDATRRWTDERRKSANTNRGVAPLLKRLFSSRGGSSYYPN